MTKIKPGDYVLIQFGHNDCTPVRPNRYSNPTEFKEWLAKYVDAVRAFGATPIFVTPPNRGYTENGNMITGGKYTTPGTTFMNSFQAWTDAQRELAAEKDVDLIEFNYYTIEYYNYIGCDEFYASVSTDGTHFKDGPAADRAASQLSYLISKSSTGLAPYATGKMGPGVAEKFDFGSGSTASGYTPVTNDAYDADKGYGWTTTGISAVAGSGDDALKSDFVQTTAKTRPLSWTWKTVSTTCAFSPVTPLPLPPCSTLSKMYRARCAAAGTTWPTTRSTWRPANIMTRPLLSLFTTAR